jgi:hypothetical protein
VSKNKALTKAEPTVNRESFLAAIKPKIIFKEVEDIGTIGFSMLSTAERIELVEAWNLNKTNPTLQQLSTLDLLLTVLTDEAGKKLLTVDDFEALKKGNAKLVDTLIHHALDINGMTKQSVETLEKNSEPALSD